MLIRLCFDDDDKNTQISNGDSETVKEFHSHSRRSNRLDLSGRMNSE